MNFRLSNCITNSFAISSLSYGSFVFSFFMKSTSTDSFEIYSVLLELNRGNLGVSLIISACSETRLSEETRLYEEAELEYAGDKAIPLKQL